MPAVLRLAAGAALISFSPVFVAVAHTGPTAIAFYRMAIGAVVLLGLTGLRRLALPRDHAAMVLAGAGLLLSLDLVLWHHSIRAIGPGMATILGNLQVFFVAGFGALVLREHVTWRLLSGITLAVAGLMLVFGGHWSEAGTTYHWGIVFGLCTALLYATMVLVLRAVQLRADAPSPMSALTWLSLVGAAGLAPGVPLAGESFGVPDAGTFGALVGYGVVSQVLGWLLITQGLPGVPASRAGLVLLLQPFLAFLWDVILFARPTSSREVIGVTVALAAIYLGSVSRANEMPG